MDIKEKAAYLKGLTDGMKLAESDEATVIKAIVDLLGDIAAKLDEVDEDLQTNNDYIEEIDEDLGALEEYVLGDDDECDCCDCDDEDYDDECDCDCCDCDEDDFRMIMCPHCNAEVYFDEDSDPEDMLCPACGKKIAGDCDCGCCGD